MVLVGKTFVDWYFSRISMYLVNTWIQINLAPISPYFLLFRNIAWVPVTWNPLPGTWYLGPEKSNYFSGAAWSELRMAILKIGWVKYGHFQIDLENRISRACLAGSTLQQAEGRLVLAHVSARSWKKQVLHICRNPIILYAHTPFPVHPTIFCACIVDIILHNWSWTHNPAR